MTEETTTATPEKAEENAAEKNKNPQPEQSAGKKDSSSSDKKPRRGVRRERKPKEAKEFEESILQIDRVTRVVKGGRRLRFRVSVIIGDQKGRVGFGIGKSSEVMIGIQKAVAKAKKNLIKVPIFNGTLPHSQKGEFKSSQVLLFPATEGKGIIAGGAVRKILELAGVKDVLSKVHGSRNKLNVAHATMNALQDLIHEDPNPKKETDKADETPKKETPESKKSEKKDDKKEAPKKKAPAKKTTSKK